MALGGGTRPRIKDGEQLPTRHYSSRQEKQIADKLNIKTTPNSGATPWVKGDLLSKYFLLEAKTRTSHCESISIKKDWITKNREEMVFMGKPHQAIVFNFGPDEENHYIIDEYLFQELLEYLEKKQDI